MTVLPARALGRAALARQLLTRRTAMPAAEAVAVLGGLQAQDPNSPYLSLWSRLADFDRADLTAAVADRSVVRSSVLRGTQHIVTAADFGWMRALMQPVLARTRQAGFGSRTAGVDLDELAETGRKLLTGRTLTRPQLRDELAPMWPDVEPAALAWSVQALVPIVHPAPEGTWNRRGATPFVLAEEWLGAPLDPAPALEPLVTRYLAAYGPATVRDVQAWSGLTRLADTVTAMDLVRYEADSGAVLYDLPDAPPIEADASVPVRFLPEFDNLVVAYADRSRLMTERVRRKVCIGSWVQATVLVDGQVRAVWRLQGGTGARVLRIEQFTELSDREKEEVAAEGGELLRFMGEEAAVEFA